MATEAPVAFHWGTGRRKSSVARVRVFETGSGDIVNMDILFAEEEYLAL